MQKLHFIAIGGAVMHNLAIALHHKGYNVTGSDDEIFDPALSRLKQYGLLPDKTGWDTDKITADLDAVILGMHARADNPELLRANELGVKVYSFPEFIYEQSKDKTRVVIGGSHGKTTITAMIMHVMRECGKNFDYMVGSQLAGFETMVKLSDSAPIIVLEGDEYLTSPLDRRPKFHLYLPHIALISGIAWDHINVFPTFEEYVKQFEIFIGLIRDGGTLIYCAEDDTLKMLAENSLHPANKISYGIPSHRIEGGITILETVQGDVSLKVFGQHNLMNLEAARLVCEATGIGSGDFYTAISGFAGAAKRLELIAASATTAVYKDFAHSPSKLKATVEAVRSQYPGRELVACMELHTFSSLSGNFLDHYSDSMNAAHIPIVYFNPHTIEHKKLPPITMEQVVHAFGNKELRVFTDSAGLHAFLLSLHWNNKNLLMMSSGNFDGLDLAGLAEEVISPV